MSNKEEFIQNSDIVNAIAYLKAREAGLIEETTTDYDIGVYGGMVSDITETSLKLLNNEITYERAEQYIEEIILDGVRSIIIGVYDAITKPILDFIERKIPELYDIVEDVYLWIRDKIVEKVTEYAEKAINWVMETGKKLIQWIFK